MLNNSVPRPKFVPRVLQPLVEISALQPLFLQLRNLLWTRVRNEYGALPIHEVFARTYRSKLWGSLDGSEFFSGRGSLTQFVTPYVEWVCRFIADHCIKTVVDLGCGDYRVGERICANSQVNYIGIDIVPELISYNRSKFSNERVTFYHVNIIDDALPDGDICLIRQVLQHLSNDEIARVIANCSKFRYLVVTEDVYVGKNFVPNVDIKHGPDTRVYKRSGVVLDQAPFNLATRYVVDIPSPHPGSLLRTCLIELAPGARHDAAKASAGGASLRTGSPQDAPDSSFIHR